MKLMMGDLISLGEQILQNSWIIWSPLLYFNFRSLKDPNFSSFFRFQFVLHDAVVLFSGFSNFLKLKMGDLISWGGNQFCKAAELFGPPSSISILEIWRTQNFPHSLDLNASLWVSSTFVRFSKIHQIKEGGPNFLGGTNSAERLNYLVPPSVFQF